MKHIRNLIQLKSKPNFTKTEDQLMKKLYDALLISVEKRERLLAKAIELLDEADFLYAEAVKEDNLYKAHLRKINSQLGKYFKRTDNKKN